MGEIKILFQDDKRLGQLNSEMSGLSFFDPQGDNPIDPQLESLMDHVGAKAYLMALKDDLGMDSNPPAESLDEFRARRAVRIMIRKSFDYKGERFIQ